MTKTFEQLAEEYAAKEGKPWGCEQYFLAGYQAAKDQLADADKVMPQWISVKERLPEITHIVRDNGNGYTDNVLMLFTDGTMEVMEFEQRDGLVETGHGNSLDIVTHWMPLPEPPKDEA